jgi:hypothetical protein
MVQPLHFKSALVWSFMAQEIHLWTISHLLIFFHASRDSLRQYPTQQHTRESTHLQNLEHYVSQLGLWKELFAVLHELVQVALQAFENHVQRVVFSDYFLEFYYPEVDTAEQSNTGKWE